MKKFISLLTILLLITGISVYADSTEVSPVKIETNEDGVIQPAETSIDTAKENDYNVQGDIKYSIWKALKIFVGFINWIFVILFTLIAWLINDTAEAKNGVKWFSWFDKIPKTLRSLLIGLILAIVFYWGFNYDNRTEVMSLIFSIIVTMVIYKIGVNKVLRWASKKFGIKFEDEENETIKK